MKSRGSESSNSRAGPSPASAREPATGPAPASTPPRPPSPAPSLSLSLSRWIPPRVLTWILVVVWILVVGSSFTEYVLTARDRAAALLPPRPAAVAVEERAALRREIRSSALGHLAFGIAGVVLLSMADTWIRRRDRDLDRQRARLAAIFDSTPDLLALKDRQLVYQSVNPAFARFVGRSAADLVGRTDGDLFSPAEADRFREADRRVLATGIPVAEDQCHPMDGSRRWLHVARTPVRDAQGAIEGVLCSMRDVTARREDELALARRDAVLSAAQSAGERFLRSRDWGEILPEAVADIGRAVDVSRVYVFENHESADGRLLTSQRHEWIAEGTPRRKPLPMAGGGSFRQHGLDRWAACLGRGEVLCGSPGELPPPERDLLLERDVRSTALVPIHTASHWWGFIGFDECRRDRAWQPSELDSLRVVAQMIGSCIERQRIEADLRQSQKMDAVGQLAGGVAHDFNNILTATLMQLGLLREVAAGQPEVAQLVRELEQGAQRAAHLTRQLLVFSRKSVLEIRPVQLHDLVADLLGMLRRLLGETIELELRESAPLPPVEADAGLLGQVVLNLCLNARDAMARNGRLTLATRAVELSPEQVGAGAEARPGSFVCLSVTDTGTGIAPAVLPHIFEPFFTTKEVGRGTGLGLATVHGIVKQHRGWVEVDTALGQGTTFRVFLPAAHPHPSGPCPLAPSGATRGGQETLLLVEDEPEVCSTIARGLRRHGYEVLEADTARAALALWSRHARGISLLFTDQVLPDGLNGLELARLLRRERPDLRVIVSSGYLPESLPAPTPGGFPFVRFPKPYDLEALATEIRRVLDQPPVPSPSLPPQPAGSPAT